MEVAPGLRSSKMQEPAVLMQACDTDDGTSPKLLLMGWCPCFFYGFSDAVFVL